MATGFNACFFCGSKDIEIIETGFEKIPFSYTCLICGHVKLTEEAADDFVGENFSKKDKLILSIVHRNDYEKKDKYKQSKPYSLEDLHRFINRYVIFDTIEKINNALLIINKK